MSRVKRLQDTKCKQFWKHGFHPITGFNFKLDKKSEYDKEYFKKKRQNNWS